jgi:Second Messenger Oligonucleotide or Dinucleotide Synthetase domain
MHREDQITQLMTRKKQMVVGLLDKLCQQVEITETQFQTAKTRYEAVGAWLSGSSSHHLDQAQIYPQGSIALGTAIKPLATNEFDVDLVCHLPSLGHTSCAKAAKQLVGARLKEHPVYKGMLEEKKRCWRINYANEFHLDITPSIINPRCLQDGELVPDKTLAEWKPTNPKGYIDRFEQYASIRPRFALLERDFAKIIDGTVEPLPEPSMSKPFLKRIVQLLKRHRDKHFAGSNSSELAPISVIITTLAGWAYASCSTQQTYANEFDFVTGVIREMPTFIELEMRSGKPFYIVKNETTAGENFADKWNHDPKRVKAFYEWHADVLDSVESLLQIEGVDQFAERLSHKFGGKKDAVRDVLSKFIEPIGQARSKGLLGISPSIGLINSPSFGSVAIPKNTFFGR